MGLGKTDLVLKRSMPLLVGGMVVALAFTTARAVSAIVSMGLVPEPAALAASGAATAAPTTNDSAAEVPARNMNVLIARMAPLRAEAAPEAAYDDAPCRSLAALGIIESEKREGSLALVKDGTARTQLVAIGSLVGDRELVAVAPLTLTFRRGDSLCDVALGGKPTAASTDGGTRTVAQPAPMSGIRQNSETDFTVDRGTRDQLIEGMASVGQAVRLVPEMENGKSVGFRIQRLMPTSPLRSLGLRDGDRLSSVNGANLGDTESLVAMYPRLRLADRITLGVVRDGKPMTIDYRVE